jgi:hypothetical protein
MDAYALVSVATARLEVSFADLIPELTIGVDRGRGHGVARVRHAAVTNLMINSPVRRWSAR